MSVEAYIRSLGSGTTADSGEFTLCSGRARELLTEAALSDFWDAWSCILQGFYSFGAKFVDISVKKTTAQFHVGLPFQTELKGLVEQSRFVLGWLNLSHFGEVQWSKEKSQLTVVFSGSIFKRYFMSKSLRSLFSQKAAFAQCPTRLEGRLLNQGLFPRAESYTVFPNPVESPWALHCPAALLLPSGMVKNVWLGSGELSEALSVAALAYKVNSSASEISWVSCGVIVAKEKNILERPGLRVLASIEDLKLKTDISGFSVVRDLPYLEFISRLKREVLWML